MSIYSIRQVEDALCITAHGGARRRAVGALLGEPRAILPYGSALLLRRGTPSRDLI